MLASPFLERCEAANTPDELGACLDEAVKLLAQGEAFEAMAAGQILSKTIRVHPRSFWVENYDKFKAFRKFLPLLKAQGLV